MRITLLCLIVLLVIPSESLGGLKPTAPLVARRAVLIGIDDYSASTIPAARPLEHRGWPDLRGSANDVGILADMLVLLYGFERKNIITLTNQQATRAVILRSVEEHLVRPSRKGDVVFFYFAGHGAQVPNAASDEPDRLDESIIPADSRRGAADIRDKELRPLFNRILDRGARLTLLLDHCHSGGSFRGLPNGARSRGIAPARPIVDNRNYGPRPDDRGALVLASTQDLDSAWEIRGDDGRMHGAFTWAWIRALRDAVADEPAQETFLRAQARLRGEVSHQAPAMLGGDAARRRPFLGTTIDRRGEREVIAVEKVQSDGSVVLQGGWAHGLGIGSVLRPLDAPATRLRITAILGLGRSVATMPSPITTAVHSGALLEVVRWSAPQERPLRDLMTLRRIHMWSVLTSPPNTAAPYRLAVRHETTRKLVSNGTVVGQQVYSIVLRAAEPLPAHDAKRYYYVFVIDTHGNSFLVFPKTGSVENRFPIGDAAPPEIALGAPSAFRVRRPYGIDMYVLLSTEEALPNPAILGWDGVRAARTLAATRWSIERIPFESVAPRKTPNRDSYGVRR